MGKFLGFWLSEDVAQLEALLPLLKSEKAKKEVMALIEKAKSEQKHTN